MILSSTSNRYTGTLILQCFYSVTVNESFPLLLRQKFPHTLAHILHVNPMGFVAAILFFSHVTPSITFSTILFSSFYILVVIPLTLITSLALHSSCKSCSSLFLVKVIAKLYILILPITSITILSQSHSNQVFLQ